MVSLTDKDFQDLVLIVQRFTGILFNEQRRSLLANRLEPLMRTHGLKDHEALVASLKNSPSKYLVDTLVDAVTTNETSFFRDTQPFEVLVRRLYPQVLANASKLPGILIWSAGCSSGQEAYTIAMALKSHFATADLIGTRILGTDISEEVLAVARRGVYTQAEVARGLPGGLLGSFFKSNPKGWEAKPEIRQLVSFRNESLLEEGPAVPLSSLVFCRNVTIYFSEEGRRKAFQNIARRMHSGGILVTGTAESADHYCSEFTAEWEGSFLYYRRK